MGLMGPMGPMGTPLDRPLSNRRQRYDRIARDSADQLSPRIKVHFVLTLSVRSAQSSGKVLRTFDFVRSSFSPLTPLYSASLGPGGRSIVIRRRSSSDWSLDNLNGGITMPGLDTDHRGS